MEVLCYSKLRSKNENFSYIRLVFLMGGGFHLTFCAFELYECDLMSIPVNPINCILMITLTTMGKIN